MGLLITGATIIDGNSENPFEGRCLWIEGERIRAVAVRSDLQVPSSATVIEAHGKYVIPGLMDANIHLMGDMRPENLLLHDGRYEDLIIEAAQITLKGGCTTVFDTWGPRRALMAVRDRINASGLPGSRIFCGGNIIGLDGPFSRDFYAKADVVSGAVAERINATFVENVGPALSWMAPTQVAQEVSTYIQRGIDFIKYASSEHRWGDPSTFLLFSPRVQSAIVDASHRAGVAAQAHTTSIESLHAAIEAGCDLIQHCNITGPVPIPESTIEMIARGRTGAVVFPFTERRFKWIMENCKLDRTYFATSDTNCRNLMRAGARLLLATDAILLPAEAMTDPMWSNFWLAPGEDNLAEFGRGHFVWMRAMEEKGCAPMDILRAASRNIAEAYGKLEDLGTLEPGKLADVLILDRNPLDAAANYERIHMIIKGGRIVERESLPSNPIQTKPADLPHEELLAYRAHRYMGRSSLPMCPMCVRG